MTNSGRIILGLTMLLCATVILTGGSIDYLTQQSAGYVRILSRNAVVEEADAVNYNPAGTAMLPEGFYIQVNNHTVLKNYVIEATPPGGQNPVEYKSTEPTYFLPSLFAVFKKQNFAVFGAFTVPAGGGMLNYDDGLYTMALLETGLQQSINPYYFARLTDGYLEGSSNYLAGTIGFSYQFNRYFSAAVAGRYISAMNRYQGEGDFVVIDAQSQTEVGTTHRELDAEKRAAGLGGIIGVDVAVNEQLNIGLRYETVTPLEFETETAVNDWSLLPSMESFNDGYKQRKDLPALLGMGVSYQFIPQLKGTLGGNYYFINQADQGEDDYYDDDYDDGWEIQGGLEYRFTPQLLASMGYQYTKVGGNEDTYNDFEYKLDAHVLGMGGRYSFPAGVDCTLGIVKVFYLEGEGSGTYEGAVYNKDIWMFALGLQYKII